MSQKSELGKHYWADRAPSAPRSLGARRPLRVSAWVAPTGDSQKRPCLFAAKTILSTEPLHGIYARGCIQLVLSSTNLAISKMQQTMLLAIPIFYHQESKFATMHQKRTAWCLEAVSVS